MKIYLAGSVPKGDEEKHNSKDWRDNYIKIIQNNTGDHHFINPLDRGDDFDESDFLAVFGFDCNQIKSSDLIIVNGEKEIGVGTSQEMVIAKYFEKPVITILSDNPKYVRTNMIFRGKTIEKWIHPFVYNMSDLILKDIQEITKEALTIKYPKKISIIEKSISHLATKYPNKA